MAVLSAILRFVHCLVAFTNAELVERVGPLLDNLSYSSRQATYSLRRLIRKGVITRIPGTQRYQLTPFGRRITTWFSKVHSRVLTPGLAWTDPPRRWRSPPAALWPSPVEPSTEPSINTSPTRCSPRHLLAQRTVHVGADAQALRPHRRDLHASRETINDPRHSPRWSLKLDLTVNPALGKSS
jgi:hypothetical protein